MDFQLREEQQQFADALRRWVDKDYGHEARRQIIHSASGVSDSAWQTLVELGMTALPVPEEQGGFNGGAVDLWVVMQELGRGLVVEPYFRHRLGGAVPAPGRQPGGAAGAGGRWRTETGLRTGRAAKPP